MQGHRKIKDYRTGGKMAKPETNKIGYLLGVYENKMEDKKANVTSSSISFYMIWDFESYYCFTHLKKLKSIRKGKIK